jgi:hypothetical protein
MDFKVETEWRKDNRVHYPTNDELVFKFFPKRWVPEIILN